MRTKTKQRIKSPMGTGKTMTALLTGQLLKRRCPICHTVGNVEIVERGDYEYWFCLTNECRKSFRVR